MFPELFARVTRRGVPMTGIIISQAPAGVVVLLVLLGGSEGITVLDIVLSVAGIAPGAVFVATVIADIAEARKSGTRLYPARRLGVVVALVFSLAVMVSSGLTAAKYPQAVAVLVAWLRLGAVTLLNLRPAGAGGGRVVSPHRTPSPAPPDPVRAGAPGRRRSRAGPARRSEVPATVPLRPEPSAPVWG